MTNLRVMIGMSLQGALLDQVAPELRGVEVELNSDDVFVNCYFDGAISEAHRDDISIVQAEVAADMPPELPVQFRMIRLDWPERLPNTAFWAFRRKEPLTPY